MLLKSITMGVQIIRKSDVDSPDFNIAAFSEKTGITKLTPEDVQYLKAGDDSKKPKKGDIVTIHYIGTCFSDSPKEERPYGKRSMVKFDSSRDANRNAFKTEIGTGKVIKGWDEGVPQLGLGERAILVITHDYAYGAQAFPPKIPEFAALTFDVELLKIN
ncbi:hypothetical protein C8R43DRAFT_1177047 [Mycena crocata]|nr:hypothetical protein C8R43DRAFT_1177047 [Mycena crocata]